MAPAATACFIMAATAPPPARRSWRTRSRRLQSALRTLPPLPCGARSPRLVHGGAARRHIATIGVCACACARACLQVCDRSGGRRGQPLSGMFGMPDCLRFWRRLRGWLDDAMSEDDRAAVDMIMCNSLRIAHIGGALGGPPAGPQTVELGIIDGWTHAARVVHASPTPANRYACIAARLRMQQLALLHLTPCRPSWPKSAARRRWTAGGGRCGRRRCCDGRPHGGAPSSYSRGTVLSRRTAVN